MELRSGALERLKGESIVGTDVAIFFNKEQFVVGLIGRQETDAIAIQGKTIQWAHAQNGVKLSIILLLHPKRELAIEALQRREVQFQGEELFTRRSEKPFDFSFGCAVAYGRVGEQAADPSADLDDFLGGVDRSIIDVQTSRDPALIESCAQRLDKSIDVLGREELPVTTDA